MGELIACMLTGMLLSTGTGLIGYAASGQPRMAALVAGAGLVFAVAAAALAWMLDRSQ